MICAYFILAICLSSYPTHRMTLNTEWSECGCLWGERSSWVELWNSIGQREHAAKEDGSKLRWGVCAVTSRNGDRHAIDQFGSVFQGDCTEQANTFRTKLWTHTLIRKLVREGERKKDKAKNKCLWLANELNECGHMTKKGKHE